MSAKQSPKDKKKLDDSFADFLKSATTSFTFHTGETFSGKLFKDWNPTEAEQKIFFDNWSTKIKNLPIEFFPIFLSNIFNKQLPKIEFKNICYLKINYYIGKIKSQKQHINIPFLKTKYHKKQHYDQCIKTMLFISIKQMNQLGYYPNTKIMQLRRHKEESGSDAFATKQK